MASEADDATHLEVRGLGKSFGATRALDEVSVAVGAGTVHAFVGENGAGKSTLGKIIAVCSHRTRATWSCAGRPSRSVPRARP